MPKIALSTMYEVISNHKNNLYKVELVPQALT